MQAEQLRQFVIDKADDMKARDIDVLDVKGKTDVADFMVICSGNSKTHVRSIAEHVATEAKHAGIPPLGIEGGEQSEWVLVDLIPYDFLRLNRPKLRQVTTNLDIKLFR